VTIGVKHFKYWEVNDKTMKAKSGAFGKNCNILCSIAVKEQNIYVGASDGSIQMWNGNSCSKSMKIHGAAINALCLVEDILLTGSND
jgi:hypothetical protein